MLVRKLEPFGHTINVNKCLCSTATNIKLLNKHHLKALTGKDMA